MEALEVFFAGFFFFCFRRPSQIMIEVLAMIVKYYNAVIVIHTNLIDLEGSEYRKIYPAFWRPQIFEGRSHAMYSNREYKISRFSPG